MMAHWMFLALSIVTEVAGTTSMKLSEGFTKPVFTALIFVFYGVSFYFFSQAIKRMDLGAAYAIWAGLGTALIALIGVVYFRDGMDIIKAISLAAIIAGVIGLNLSGAHVSA
jgi:small multidrug resistance pump